MRLKTFWGKGKRRTGTPKSDSLNYSISDSENSYKMEMLEVTNEAAETAEEKAEADAGGDEVGADGEKGDSASGDGSGEEAAKEEPPTADTAAEDESNEQPQQPPKVVPAITGDRTPAQRHRRSRGTSVGTTPSREDEYESQERREKEEAMIRLWRRATTPKKLPFPSRYPGYLKEPPELSYEDTNASLRRRHYNDTRIKEYKMEPFKRDDSKVKHLSPKTNRAVELRSKFIRRQPLVSKYFSDHYNEHKKPPFKITNVKHFI